MEGGQSSTSQSYCLRPSTTLDYGERSTINVGLSSRDANAITAQTTFARKDKLKGFTLAEVLITLAIIGVVAALTIPTIISGYGRKDITTKLKKFYATMSQVIQLSEIDNGSAETWTKKSIEYNEDGSINYEANKELVTNFLNEYILPYIRYSKITDGTYGTESGNGVNSKRVYLSDGTYFEAKNGACIDIYYDANGEKGPDVYGKDKFIFIFCNLPADKIFHFDSPNQVFGPFTHLQVKNYETRDLALERCKISAGECAVLLQRYDNFEFKKDYPY